MLEKNGTLKTCGLALFLFLAFCLIWSSISTWLGASSEPASTQASGGSFKLNDQYSAEIVMTTREGHTVLQKIYSDGGKVRIESTVMGKRTINIFRPDQKKLFFVIEAAKRVIERSSDGSELSVPLVLSPRGECKAMGSDTVNDEACTEYKVIGKDNRVSFFWVDMSKKTLVKEQAGDGLYTAFWRNYVPGPQDAALFEPPADYQTISAGPGGAGQ